MFKAQNYDDACKKYQSAISVLRCNLDLHGVKEAKDAEVALRSNLSLCKLNLKLYDDVVEQCEKILESDSKNAKASYRMAQAVFALSDGKSVSQLESALKYAKQAHEGIPRDHKVKNFYNEVKE